VKNKNTPENEPAQAGKKHDANKTSERAGGVDTDQLLEHILDTMVGGLYTVDAGGLITSWNRGMEELSGYQASEMIGQSCLTMEGDVCFGGACVPEGHLSVCPLFKSGTIKGRRCRIKTKDGRRVTIVKSARVMKDPDGKIIGGIESVFDISDTVTLEDEVIRLRSECAGRSKFGSLIGRSTVMQRLYDLIDMAARGQSSVLIQGETGTGKELVAAAIHESSPRSTGPFVKISCSALSESLLESELFGHVKGAFTGAHTDRTGRFEAADKGTIFLDEIGDISPVIQSKLLRVLQEREFERVGENRPIPVDIRIIAASNKNLKELCDSGAFRQDLYFRLAVIPVEVPPLRTRLSDIPVLVEHFLTKLCRLEGRPPLQMTPEALSILENYPWPGNVRELENAIEYAFVLAKDNIIDANYFPAEVRQVVSAIPKPSKTRNSKRPPDDDIRKVLFQVNGSRTEAAKILGVSRVSLWKWIKELH